jgi:hypothetical protein
MDTHNDAIIHRVSQPARIAALAAVALLIVALPSAADAGTYNVTACNAAPSGVNNSWEPFNTDPTHLQTHLSCPYTTNQGQQANQENGISTTDILELPNGAQAGAEAGWALTAPGGTIITAITYQRMLSTLDQNWVPALRADGTILPEQTCTPPISGSCLTGSGPGGENQAALTGLSAHTLTLGLRCTAPTGQQCITGGEHFHAAVATMYSATVTLTDPTPPTLNTPTGALWEPGAHDSFHKGTESVTVSAQDVGGGVQSIVLAADGHPVETYSAPCNFTFVQPCPLSTGQQTLTLPTSELSDGAHTLTITATDAAGNESEVATQQITVANEPPPSPTNLIAVPIQTGGSTFNVTWTNPADIAPITEATYQICPANGLGTCAEPLPAPPDGPATVTVPGPGLWTLAVWLYDAAGNSRPANAAHVTLTVTPEASHGGSGGGSNSNGKGSGSSNSDGNGSTAPKSQLHIVETVHRHKLTVHVTGPSSGTVKVHYTARYRGKVIAVRSKTTVLRHGKLTVTFTLPARAATHATIRISAQLGHDPPATSTLLRRH